MGSRWRGRRESPWAAGRVDGIADVYVPDKEPNVLLIMMRVKSEAGCCKLKVDGGI